MQLSEFEKKIYNQYLYASRTHNNKPFSPRKQFDDLDNENIVACKQIAMLLQKFPNINIKDFFDAPFKMQEGGHIKLPFYKSMRAIKLFSLYNYEQMMSADSQWNLDKIKESMIFIYKFCKLNNIEFQHYMHTKTPADVAWFVLHLQQFSINIYALLAFPDADKQLNGSAQHLDEIIGNNLSKKLSTYTSKFITSNKCKNTARQAYQKITTTNLAKQTT